MTYITDTQPALSSSWLSSSVASFSYKMSTPDCNTDVTERDSTSKEKADEIVDKRGKTNSVVWKWFGFLRSDKLQVSVLCKMCRRVVPTSSGNRGEMRLKRGHVNGCRLRRLLAYHDNRLHVRVESASVYPACSKFKYYASEADCRTSARSLFPLSLLLLCSASV